MGWNQQEFEQNCSLIDMHAHWNAGTAEITYRKEHGIFTVFSSGTRQEWENLKSLKENPIILRSFGIHPWYADQTTPEEMTDAYQEADYIGEIGMDNVWCETDLNLQKKQLEKQLQIAADLQKPILLHTKGQEACIGDMIRDFPEKICVHWYSGTETDLEPYLEKNCYFTLGPDTPYVKEASARRSRRRILSEVPLTHLFTETDGLSAIAWALEQENADLSEIGHSLIDTIHYLSKQKNLPPKLIQNQLKQNFLHFIEKSAP